MDIDKNFEILRISPRSSLSEVKQAYRDLVNVWHPDRFSHNDRLKRKAEDGQDIYSYSRGRSALEVQFYLKNNKVTRVVWLCET